MRLQRYIFLELLPPLVTGALLFTAIVSFGYFFVSSQFLSEAPLPLILRYIALQVPDTLVRVFPMAVVLMVVTTYGRLANERELSAMQSGGISLRQAATPAVVIAALVSGSSILLSEYVVPRANVEARSFYWDDLTQAGLSQLSGRTVEIGQGLEMHFRAYDSAKREMQDVRLQQWTDNGAGRAATLLFARRGTFEGNVITLTGYEGYGIDYAAIRKLDALPENAKDDAFRRAVQGVFTRYLLPPNANARLQIETGLSRKQTIAQFADAIAAESRSITQLWRVMHDPRETAVERRAARAELQRRIALPFGNLVLVLAALPFALRYGRTTGVAFGVALLIAISYYLTYIIGLSLTSSFNFPPEIGAWLANVLFAAGGLWMLRRA